MANFKLFQDKILQIEGGYNDSFGLAEAYTDDDRLIGVNRGITARTLENYLGRRASAEEMKNLSRRLALKIYEEEYWNRYRLNEFLSQELAELVADSIIQHGPGNANDIGGVTILQEALNDLGEDLKVDGRLGPLTVAAANRQSGLNGAALYNIIREDRIAYYKELALSDPAMAPNLTGWLNRMEQHYPAKAQGVTITATPDPVGTTIELASKGDGASILLLVAVVVVPTVLLALIIRATGGKYKPA